MGISGEEGLQAVNSSDYAIAQVSDLMCILQRFAYCPFSSDSLKNYFLFMGIGLMPAMGRCKYLY